MSLQTFKVALWLRPASLAQQTQTPSSSARLLARHEICSGASEPGLYLNCDCSPVIVVWRPQSGRGQFATRERAASTSKFHPCLQVYQSVCLCVCLSSTWHQLSQCGSGVQVNWRRARRASQILCACETVRVGRRLYMVECGSNRVANSGQSGGSSHWRAQFASCLRIGPGRIASGQFSPKIGQSTIRPKQNFCCLSRFWSRVRESKSGIEESPKKRQHKKKQKRILWSGKLPPSRQESVMFSLFALIPSTGSTLSLSLSLLRALIIDLKSGHHHQQRLQEHHARCLVVAVAGRFCCAHLEQAAVLLCLPRIVCIQHPASSILASIRTFGQALVSTLAGHT